MKGSLSAGNDLVKQDLPLTPLLLETRGMVLDLPCLEEFFPEVHLATSYSPFRDQSKWHFLQEAFSKKEPLSPPQPGCWF